MKNLSFVILITFCVCALQNCKSSSKGDRSTPADTAHASKTSLDWDGIYRGVLPCADCEGIETTITLSKDAHYTLATRYLGKSDSVFERSATFNWSEQGNTIQLSGGSASPAKFFVGEILWLNWTRMARGLPVSWRINIYCVNRLMTLLKNTGSLPNSGASLCR